ncbi:MAG TPA: 2-amino-4-hydroxy-6-hydroxymethyldihydropteridine diphosphokinase [Candidatus Dormibacteraeota bacterium]|nr:2-amino-4-hydroxy-6-hydroxymethyldihydropteridine diphosphokinase [Candidatus Dormibacteraeota bacterium]
MKTAAATEGSQAVLALGSNLPRRAAWLDLALTVFKEEGVAVIGSTPRWNTAAIGTVAQPDFLNQLLLVRGPRQGQGWLQLAQAAEARAGRRRGVPKGPRTLDVDVILIEGESWDSRELTVPHPGLLQRPYLLRGVAQLVPDWIHPIEGIPIAALARRHLTGSWAWREPEGTRPG